MSKMFIVSNPSLLKNGQRPLSQFLLANSITVLILQVPDLGNSVVARFLVTSERLLGD